MTPPPTPRPAAPKGRQARTQRQFSAYAAVLQAAERLQRGFADLLKAHDLSGAQYNVLRVLRGAGPGGMTCGEVGGRLIQHDPDVTRLLDRLDGRGLIARTRDTRDRRIVRTSISAAGLALLANLDAPIDEVHERQLGHMTDQQLEALTQLLTHAQQSGN